MQSVRGLIQGMRILKELNMVGESLLSNNLNNEDILAIALLTVSG